MIQQLESFSPETPESANAQQVLNIAFRIYKESYQAYNAGQYLRAAEYAVAVKDLMRAIDKFYNVAIAS